MLAATKACADEPQKRPWKDPGTVLLEAAGGLWGTDPAQQWCSRTSDAGHEDGQVCTCSVWDVSVPLSLAINCQLPKDSSVLTRLAVRLRSQPVPDATLVLGSVPEVAVGLLSRGTWLQPPQVHGQGVTMGKGERGVWGCGEAAGRCLGAGAGDAGVSSSEGQIGSQEGGRVTQSPCFNTSCVAGGSFAAGRGESFTLAVPGYHFIQKLC